MRIVLLAGVVVATLGCKGAPGPGAPEPPEPPVSVTSYEGTFSAAAGTTEANLTVTARKFRLVTATPPLLARGAVWGVMDGRVEPKAGTVVLSATAVTVNGEAIGIERYAHCIEELAADGSFPDLAMTRLLDCLEWIDEAPTEARRITPGELVVGSWRSATAPPQETLTISAAGMVTWRLVEDRVGGRVERRMHLDAKFGDGVVRLELRGGGVYADGAPVHTMTAAEVQAYQNKIDARGAIYYTVGAEALTWRLSLKGEGDYARFQRRWSPTDPVPPGEHPVKPVLIGYASRPTDPFKLQRAAIEGDLLVLEVSYGGGCAQHRFELLTSDAFQEGSPVVLGTSLFHDAGGDACEAWLTSRLRFDLNPVKELYRQTYQETTGSVRLRLAHAPDPLIYRF